ncbi:hypothetical protein COU80_03310 [Candidatus Peregrinibacteria bacterium CG10_big_fil_rev_8_21_14_0_10_55_24]|nr:MAG: hypothetical protein COU80_03310 [Candidatus Peregrinibacteria bacterium CG10_big_fil_rev_8_21_14_0_10_55_24]
MRKILPLLLVSILAMTACNRSVSTESGTPGTAISERSTAMQVSPASQQPVWVAIKAWAPDLTWSELNTGTNDDLLWIDMEHSIPAHALQTQFIQSAPVVSHQFNALSVSRDALASDLSPLGWKSSNMLDADGPTGTIWGYRMESDVGIRFLIMSIHGKECVASSDRPIGCSSFVTQATVTDVFPAGADL